MISIIIASRDGTIPSLSLDGNYEIISVAGIKGVSRARNLGASQASGNILLFDDDDIDLCGSLNELEYSPCNWWQPTYLNGTMDWYSTASIIGINMMGSGPVIAVRKDLFFQVGGYKNMPWEDVNLHLRLKKISEPGTMNVIATVKRPFEQLSYIRSNNAR